MVQLTRFLGKLLGPIIKTGLPLIGNVLKPLGKSVLVALASATDAAIQKKIFGSGTTILTVSNEKMNDIMEIFKSLDKSCEWNS